MTTYTENISILMPTYNRSRFLPLIHLNLTMQTYPHNLLTIYIDDDGDEALFETIEIRKTFEKAIKPIQLKYMRTFKRKSIGEKRNNLCRKSKDKIMVMMDDDDIYMPSYIQYSYDMLKQKKMGLVGSNSMLFVYPFQDFHMTAIATESKRQIHEATMMFSMKHFKSMGGFGLSSQGEGSKMIDGMNPKRIFLTEVKYCMICVGHDKNTIDKNMFNKDALPDNVLQEQLQGAPLHILQDIFNVGKIKLKNENDEDIAEWIEKPERDICNALIMNDDKVLELGARYGGVSCAINNNLDEEHKKYQVSVEPDERVWGALEKNMIDNKCLFNIVKGFISNNKLSLTNLDECLGGYGATSIHDEDTKIKSYDMNDIKKQYNIDNFNVLVADCEGGLGEFMDENMDMLEHLRLIIFEADYEDKCNYDKLREIFKSKGFVEKLKGHQNIYIRD